jgi:hypothetical protein
MGCIPVGEGKPEEVIQSTAVAVQRGEPVVQKLQEGARLTMLQSIRGSLAGFRSGLKSWVLFSVTVLQYEVQSVFPPTCDTDVMCWAQVFRNAGTAANYVRFVKQYGMPWDLCDTWQSEALKMFLRGKEKACFAAGVVPRNCKVLLTWKMLNKLVKFLDGLGRQATSLLALVAWRFLLRVQSEAMEVYWGGPEHAVHVPASRHPALWCKAMLYA